MGEGFGICSCALYSGTNIIKNPIKTLGWNLSDPPLVKIMAIEEDEKYQESAWALE